MKSPSPWFVSLLLGAMAGSPAMADSQVQTREQQRLSNPATGVQTQAENREQVYGSQMMTDQERRAYRAKMRNAKTIQEREAIRLEHHKQMQLRAKERGLSLPDEPPATGGGMGPGQGAGRGPGMTPSKGPGSPP